MDKRYQVFVSSTYADLKDERRAVMQTLMEMDCIPAGMELFPAMDEDQLAFIRKIIDDCDYYLLIIGGRYGSISSDGVSYTEKEYDYAISIGRKVIALVHDKPGELAVNKSETDPDALKKLNLFREKVKTGRLAKMWSNAHELPGLVALSLQKTIKTFPAVGWVRGDVVASSQAIQEVNQLQSKIEGLRSEIKALTDENAKLRSELSSPIEGLAGLDEEIDIQVLLTDQNGRYIIPRSCRSTWSAIFGAIAPHLLHPRRDDEVQKVVEALIRNAGHGISNFILQDQDLQTIKVQLSALNLVSVQPLGTTAGHTALFWALTPLGRKTMLELRTVQTARK